MKLLITSLFSILQLFCQIHSASAAMLSPIEEKEYRGTVRLNLSEHVKVSLNVPRDQRRTIRRDLKLLEDFTFYERPDENTLLVMDIPDLDKQTIADWFAERIKYVAEDIEIKRVKYKILKNGYPYTHTNEKPVVEKSTLTPKVNGVTMMSNLGAAMYYAGKKTYRLLGYELHTTHFRPPTMIPITSPRTGLIQVGAGLFMERFDINRRSENAMANSIRRLITYFHEARHSDGHGESLGFFHAICPEGHDYQGLNACDRNLNGPYSVATVMTKEFIKNCWECSENDIEQLKLIMLDNKSRVIEETQTFIFADKHQRARFIQSELRFKKALKDIEFLDEGINTPIIFADIQEMERELKQMEEEYGECMVVPSTFWDPYPEGQRDVIRRHETAEEMGPGE